MDKTILIAGSSGLVGSEILRNLERSNNKLVLLSRKEIANKKNINQIVVNFDDINSLDTSIILDEVYIAIGQKLSLFELIYVKKNKRKDLIKVDYEYIKSIAMFAQKCGAKSISLISAIGADQNSLNTYLQVKGKIEKEILSLGFLKVIIAQPSHLLGNRPNEKISLSVKIFEAITNFTGHFLFGPLIKFRNISSKSLAKAIISKTENSENGVHYINYNYFKKY